MFDFMAQMVNVRIKKTQMGKLTAHKKQTIKGCCFTLKVHECFVH